MAFDYDMLEWVVVGRVPLSCQNFTAYALAFSKIFTKRAKDYPQFQLGKSLLGVVTGYSVIKIDVTRNTS